MLSQLPLLIAPKVSMLLLQQDYMWGYFALCHSNKSLCFWLLNLRGWREILILMKSSGIESWPCCSLKQRSSCTNSKCKHPFSHHTQNLHWESTGNATTTVLCEPCLLLTRKPSSVLSLGWGWSCQRFLRSRSRFHQRCLWVRGDVGGAA